MASPVVPDPLAPQDDAEARRRARRGTVITLGVLAVLVFLIVILTPLSDDSSDTRLTTLRYGDGNARLAADLSRRLGWKIRTVERPFTGPLDSTVIYAVFDGPTPMTTEQRVAVLDAVRRGAGVLIAPSTASDNPLLDSLGLRFGKVGMVTPTPLGNCPRETDPLAALRVRTRMMTFDSVTPKAIRNRVTTVPYPAAARVLLASDVRGIPGFESTDDEDSSTAKTRAQTPIATPLPDLRPTVVAFALGRGRVVALADPDVLRTDQLRNCAMGSALTVVRGLEYLTEGRQRTLVFNEYYQRASTDGPTVVVQEWLLGSKPGRMVLTLMAAALLLLFARGRRTLAPVYRQREERRSALEHVDALATAWQAVRGTRTVARLLARGIRRRHAAGRWRTLDDTAFLVALAERHPSIADDAARLTRAMETAPAPSDLPALRQAAAHIDAECLTP